MRELKQH